MYVLLCVSQALAGGQIIISSDPRNMTDFQKKLWFNEEVLAMYVQGAPLN